MVKKQPKIQNRSTKDDAITQRLPVACVDEGAAADFMEHQRWGASPACPLCGSFDVYKMMDSANPRKRQANFRWRCKDCKGQRSEEHTSELQSLTNLVCRLLLEKKKRRERTTDH